MEERCEKHVGPIGPIGPTSAQLRPWLRRAHRLRLGKPWRLTPSVIKDGNGKSPESPMNGDLNGKIMRKSSVHGGSIAMFGYWRVTG
jgi:hypothetical protein